MKPSDFTSKRAGKLEKIDKEIYAFVPDPLPRRMEFSREIRDASERALLALGKLDAIIPALPNPELLTEPFMRREAAEQTLHREGNHQDHFLAGAAKAPSPLKRLHAPPFSIHNS